MQYLQDYEIKQLIQSLCMMNNRFMNLMLEDNIEAAQVLLRVTLKNDKIKVKRVKIQIFIQTLYGHSVQLDILAQDENGNYFNVEVQRSDEGAQAKRARYYSSILDTHFLQAGKDYEDLPDSYVIFITENDVLGEGRATYNVDRVIRGWDKSQLKGKIYVACICIANLVEVKGLEFEKTLKFKSFVLFLRLVLSQPLPAELIFYFMQLGAASYIHSLIALAIR